MTFATGIKFLPTPAERKQRASREEPPLPSRSQMVSNALKAAARTGVSMANGNSFKVSPDTAAKRAAKCQSNECGFYRDSDGRCAHPNCGCFTSEKRIVASKTEVFAEFCPVLKWLPGEFVEVAS